MSLLTGSDKTPSDFEMVRRFFYRMYFFAYKAGDHAERAEKAGEAEVAKAAGIAAKALGDQATAAYIRYRALASKEPPGPTDVCIEPDLRLLMPEIYIAEAEGGFGHWMDEVDEEEGTDEPLP